MMQKKVGIRLRHLQTEANNQNNRYSGLANVDHAPSEAVRKRQRSPSPLNRRKIFPNPTQQQSNQPRTYQIRNDQSQQAKYLSAPRQPYYTPLTNNPQSVPNHQPMLTPTLPHNQIPRPQQTNDQNTEYYSEVQRLIDSLKKKSLELQKKQQQINKLKMQNQLCKAENATFSQEIKTLKAELEFQKSKSRISSNNYSAMGDYQDDRSNSGYGNKNYHKSNVSKNTYQNQPYEQLQLGVVDKSPIVHVKINPNKKQFKQQPKPRNNFMAQDRVKQQDSILSDYLSPLMVLNNQKPTNKSLSPLHKQITQQPQKPKTNSRISYEQPNNNNNKSKTSSRVAYQMEPTNDQFGYRTVPNNFQSSSSMSIPSSSPVQNPFGRKPQPQYINPQHQAQHRPAKTIMLESKAATDFVNYPPPSYNNRSYQSSRQEAPKWPTLQSSAAHFNTNFLTDSLQLNNGSPLMAGRANQFGKGDDYYRNRDSNNYKQRQRQKEKEKERQRGWGKERESGNRNGNKKEFAIDDSKQFRFQDFDFSELDDEVGNSRF